MFDFRIKKKATSFPASSIRHLKIKTSFAHAVIRAGIAIYFITAQVSLPLPPPLMTLFYNYMLQMAVNAVSNT